jgi:hypothetical protein
MRSKTSSAAVAGLALIAVAVVSAVPVAHAKLTPEQQCQKGRYDAAANYAQCQDKALGQHFAINDLAKLQPALSKCRVKYTSTWVKKLQKKALGTGATCDQNRFVDTSFSQTVTDNLTGLEWEKKNDLGGVNDKDNVYGWDAASSTFLSDEQGLNFLNNCVSSHFCYANECDWRLPTVRELQTILSEEFPCTASPCIDGMFGPTVADDYWSSTTLGDNPTYAWGVFFGTGEVSYGVKTLNNSVRAVRGGF